MDNRSDYYHRKAAYGRRAEERKPMPWWWLGQRDPIARFTLWLVAWTASLFLATIASVIALLVTDHTFNRQLAVMQEQLATFQADQRPWLHLVETTIESPLRFYENGAALEVTFGAKNVGRMPAQHVLIDGDLAVVTKEKYGEAPWKICDFRKTVPPKILSYGYSVFPNQARSQRRIFKIDSQELKRLKDDRNTTLVILGCIDYLFPSGSTHHQTRFFYELVKPDSNGIWFRIDPNDGDVPADSLRLVVNPLIKDDAD